MSLDSKGRNVLDRAQERRLEDWVVANWQRCAEIHRMTLAEMAVSAFGDLGFHVTAHNVRGAAATMGKSVRPPGGSLSARRRNEVLAANKAMATIILEMAKEIGSSLRAEAQRQLYEIQMKGILAVHGSEAK
jgi:hypothetical protein